MGRFVSATGQFLMATYGHFSCPPLGSFSCPLTASAITCERCSEPGVLHETRYLVKTLCASCANSLGYTPVQQDTT